MTVVGNLTISLHVEKWSPKVHLWRKNDIYQVCSNHHNFSVCVLEPAWLWYSFSWDPLHCSESNRICVQFLCLKGICFVIPKKILPRNFGFIWFSLGGLARSGTYSQKQKHGFHWKTSPLSPFFHTNRSLGPGGKNGTWSGPFQINAQKYTDRFLH